MSNSKIALAITVICVICILYFDERVSISKWKKVPTRQRAPSKENPKNFLGVPQSSIDILHLASNWKPAKITDVLLDENSYSIKNLREDWRTVVKFFMNGIDDNLFATKTIEEYFNARNSTGQKSMMVKFMDGEVSFIENYRSDLHARASSVRYILTRIAKKRKVPFPNMTFVVKLNDIRRTEGVPTFGAARHWTHWKEIIPAPLGNEHGVSQGWGNPLEAWDDYIKNIADDREIPEYQWENKIGKAVFRGRLCINKNKLGTCNEVNMHNCSRASRWEEVNRGVLYLRTVGRPDIFDVGFNGFRNRSDLNASQFEGRPPAIEKIDFKDYQKYKYVLNVGNNQDWAERLRLLLYMNSAVVYHIAETQEFYAPLMKPWIHFIPTNLMMTDLVENVEWAENNQAIVRKIVENQNKFAKHYISEQSMEAYWEIALEEFSARQKKAND